MRTAPTITEMEVMARRVRGAVIRMVHASRAPHVGSSLSCVDIIVALYWAVLRIDPDRPDAPCRDRFILSKGHAAPALYAALALRGFFPEGRLAEYGSPGSTLEEHPSRGCVPGVEVSTGSLGHGLSLGLGMALAGRLQGLSYRVFVLLSDGECNEGSVWEAALFAPAQGLGQITAIVDFNKWQATARSCETMSLNPLRDKWESFGWWAQEVDGHDLKALTSALNETPDGNGRPKVLIAHTIKGKGVSFMEDDNNWHYRSPSADDLARAFQELGLA